MIKKIFLTCLLCFIIIPSVKARALNAYDISDIIQKKYMSIKALKTDYFQILKNRSTKQENKRQGKIFCKKATGYIKIRWETHWPEEEILIITKNNIWDYFPEDKLAYKYKLTEMEQSKTILELITGRINLKNKFNIIKDEDSTQPLKYKLIPKNPEPNMVLVYIWLNKNNLIKKINIIDFFGNENIITFENTIINPKIEDNLFWETPPEDVEVLEGRPK